MRKTNPDRKSPKVSVLTPLYNTEPQHLKEMIESILNQTYTDFEFLLLNDSPKNKALKEIVKSYKDKRIVYLENKSNLGISATRNKLIDLSKGELIAVFDHDDISFPTRLEKQVKFLDDHPDIGVLGCGSVFKKGKVKRPNIEPENNLDIKIKLMSNCVIRHTGAMIRKSVLVESGVRYESEYSPAEDYMLWIRLIKHTQFHNLQEPLVIWRAAHKTSTTKNQYEKMLDKDAMIRCVAAREYPYLYMTALKSVDKRYCLFGLNFLPLITVKHSEKKRGKVWLKLLGCIPLIKVRTNDCI